MSSRPETTKEYFQMYGFQEFRGDSRVMGYIMFLDFLFKSGADSWDDASVLNVLADAQDYVGEKLGLRFNGYYIPNSSEERMKI